MNDVDRKMGNINKVSVVIAIGVIIPIGIMGLGCYFSSCSITMTGLLLLLGFIIYGAHQ